VVGEDGSSVRQRKRERNEGETDRDETTVFKADQCRLPSSSLSVLICLSYLSRLSSLIVGSRRGKKKRSNETYKRKSERTSQASLFLLSSLSSLFLRPHMSP
jgi:hypothetical protein